MTAVPDINILLYALDSKSPFHKPCIDWLNGALNGDEPLGFTWQSTLSSLEHIRLRESPALEAALLEGVRGPHRPYTKATLDRIRKNARAAK